MKHQYLEGTATFARKEFVKMTYVPTTQMTLKILRRSVNIWWALQLCTKGICLNEKCWNDTSHIKDIEMKCQYMAGTATFAQNAFFQMTNVPTSQMTIKILRWSNNIWRALQLLLKRHFFNCHIFQHK
jgi:hypothetical protein